MKTFRFLLLASLFSATALSLTSCGDDDDPTPKPGKNQWALTINGETTKYDVKAAGFFHDENRGYNFLFCDENVNINANMFQPECNWLRIDIPEEIIDQTIKNPSELNGADWDFEYQTNIENPSGEWYSGRVDACNINIKKSGTNSWKINMSLTLTNGDKFALSYDGNINEFSQYITSSDNFLYNQWRIKYQHFIAKSSAIYHGTNGYNLLICDDPNVVYKKDMPQPSCNWLRLDFPNEVVNAIVTTTSDLNRPNWKFWYQTNINNPDTYWTTSNISSCYSDIRNAGDKWKIKMRLEFKDGNNFSMSYDLSPTVVSYYITSSSTWK